MVANTPATIPDLSNWYREITEENLTPAQSLGEPLRTIWCFAKEQGDWIGTRDLLRKGYASLRDTDTETAKKYFFLLAHKGYGETQESGNTVKFKVF